ncbi:pyrimidine utilization protein A [Roseomonas marmotae]|uniref:Pyrimidine monooxygenase RutA n=1 Tax=Roseomonas marmotae TaxID=2768161 RepID=A0ABS3K8L4_9PROT|nr:pyrimidine utilization protein A [Roseomonas marmotae]MBO1073814.1 pyrimidine utilization protein A [Roseomonas marmotae]QTI78556.1 pyrimidine utilization protein A [Roseomonas marmotae]
MEIGVFIPIGNNGWLISTNAPQYKPSFELNKYVAQKAEHYGLDLLLSMIKLRGFGGKTEFWDHNLESFTLMAGLAAVTERIKLFATAPSLVLPPAIMARMAVTIDSIAPGRFGVNLITGWQRPEYSQMGLWPGDEHFRRRYEHLSEYAEILRQLWSTGQSDFKGEFFQMDDCRLSPLPRQGIRMVCAGQSQAGLEFMAKYADYNFCIGQGMNTPKAVTAMTERVLQAAAKTGRDVASLALFMIIADETDEAAMAKWEHYKAGADHEAIAWMAQQTSADTRSGNDTNVRQYALPEGAINLNIGRLIGSYAAVARMLDELAEVPGLGGVMLTFDDFRAGIDAFGERIQPLMRSRQHLRQPAEAIA